MTRQGIHATAGISSLDFCGSPPDIHIHIFQEGSGYRACIFAPDYYDYVPIGTSSHDLEALNRRLQTAMRTVACESVDVEGLTSEELIRLLAEAGNRAFKQVFHHKKAQTAISKIQDLLKPHAHIQISSEHFFLPWELIYPVSLEESLAYEHFWGTKYIISRITQPGNPCPSVIPVAKRPRLGLLTYRRLSSVEDKEIPFFERLAKDGRIVLLKLRDLDPDKKREEFKVFRKFWGEKLNLAHFACHVVYDEEDPALSYMLLSSDFPISLENLEVYPITMDNNPLVVMNACKTGSLNPLYTSHFATAFIRYGARGVVATECAVPDTFAADFAQQLYARLLAGEPLGESLLTTRRYFLKNYHNPSGLLYSIYGPSSIRLAKTGG